MSTIIKHKQFANYKVFETEVAGRPLKIEVGKIAELANASAMVTYGETTVMGAVTASARPRDGSSCLKTRPPTTIGWSKSTAHQMSFAGSTDARPERPRTTQSPATHRPRFIADILPYLTSSIRPDVRSYS